VLSYIVILGMNLTEARQPAIVERQGLRLGFLSYNCVGPRESWAGRDRAGCAYVHVLTHYELDHASPGGPPTVYTFAEPKTLECMAADIEALRQRVDVLTVALHKGLGHTPAAVGMYERQVSKAAIDVGADVVMGHHAYILQGIEVYKDRPIFHGLGNFAIATEALNIDGNRNAARGPNAGESCSVLSRIPSTQPTRFIPRRRTPSSPTVRWTVAESAPPAIVPAS